MDKNWMRLWEDESDVAEAAPAADEAAALHYARQGDGWVVTGVSGAARVIEIPEAVEGLRVVGIGASALQGQSTLEQLICPEGLHRIEQGALQGCVRLRRIHLPRRMGHIGVSALQGCAALQALSWPEGIGQVPDRALYGCIALGAIHLPGDVQRIGERAFAGCRALRAIALPAGLRAIGPMAFADCPMLQMPEIPPTVTECSADALPATLLPEGEFYLAPQAMLVRANVKRDYRLPPGTRHLAGGALQQNDSLLTVDFGEVLETLGDRALADCGCLKRALLPDAVRWVGRGAFSNCRQMTEVRLSPGMRAIAPDTFSGCHALKTVELYPGLASIGDRAFEDCRALEALKLPGGVEMLGAGAFHRCSGLEQLDLPASLRFVGAGALSGCGGLKVLILRGHLDDAMITALSDARRGAVIAPVMAPEDFPGLWRKRVCLGYAMARRMSIDYSPTAARACVQWMREHGSAFVEEALRDVQLMHLLVDEDCLSDEAVQTLIQRAAGPDREEYYLTLLDYRHRRKAAYQSELSLW